MAKYNPGKLKSFSASIMCGAGMNENDSSLFADSLVEAEMRGIASHGLTRLKTYALRMEKGLVEKKTTLTILSESPSLLLIDANNSSGVCAASQAMQLCMERARESGACFAALRGGNHFGIGAYFSDRAARNDMIGIAMTNGPAALAPFGGKKAMLGTNPFAVSIPTDRHGIFSLDMSTSVAARGKVTLAKKEHRSIPEGWGIDSDGLPTSDPAKVACMLPFGGAKGYGIGLIIEILCSCLSGACNGQTMGSFYDFSGKIQNAGFFVGALDISKVIPVAAFKTKVGELITSIKGSPRAQGCPEIFIPGEIEQINKEIARREGIEIAGAVISELNDVGEKYRVPFDCVQKKEGCMPQDELMKDKDVSISR